MIDIVLVSNSNTQKVTDECVKSIITNTLDISHNIYIVDGDKISPFNYNKALNIGAKLGNNPYIMFCNNDLIFTKGWECIIEEMKALNVRSASPYCWKTHFKWWNKEEVPNTVIGHQVGKIFAGWCFCWERSLWEEIGLSEEYQFWCSDNVTADSLIENNIPHALIKKSQILHMYSKSLNSIDNETKKQYTHDALKKYLTNKGDTKGLAELEKQINYKVGNTNTRPGVKIKKYGIDGDERK